MRIIILLFSLLMLASCGFSPVYKTSTNVVSDMSDIAIGIIPNREGQYLRNALIDKLHRGGTPTNPRYTLAVNQINEQLANLDITRTSDTTRAQLRVSTTMRLIDKQTGQTVIERDVLSVTSTNILASQFSTRVSEENARLNALNQLAEQITRNLSLYFNEQSR